MDFSEKIPAKLAEAGKELPFAVPPRYFDDFPARLKARIDKESLREEPRKVRMYDYLRPVLGLAAAFAAVFLLVFFPVKLITQPALTAEASSDAQNIINLVEHVDDHTFFSLLEGETVHDTISDDALESYLAANFSDYDIYLEIHK
ncbi:MAG TPA: hypothetical protein PLD74_08205 [Prolixibacteraceae bacterium]|mgnify:CR=1 FL=1|jgi:hypothetical protein|nr:hypothetical protein [Prolixibacteraceae bacterium]HOS00938.1 hypothetical protein [Prolixibacteraceae bacterium]HOS90671.1 hypothetical protein [Prolixibacteraceae bacterium]HPL46127.1 hypothetical protein [Prolixibacteraceae bacterium]HQB67085.1 hypothetical protein [Prolixibacteraceae bacterium]